MVYEAYNQEQEAAFVAHEARRLQRESGLRLSDIAVMYRTNAQSRALEERFVAERLPYRLVGGTRFYERREIKDLLAYLRLVVNPFDTISLERVLNVPPRRIGDKTQQELRRWAEELGVPAYTALQLLAGTESMTYRDGQPVTAQSGNRATRQPGSDDLETARPEAVDGPDRETSSPAARGQGRVVPLSFPPSTRLPSIARSPTRLARPSSASSRPERADRGGALAHRVAAPDAGDR